MPSSLPDVSTEHGFSLVLSGGISGTFKLSNVGALGIDRKEVNITDHSMTLYERYIISDLGKIGNIEFDVMFQADLGLPALDGAQGVAWVTFPKAAAQATAGRYSGTAYVLGIGYPGGAAGGTNAAKGKFKLMFDGYSFAFTAATLTP